MRDSPDCPIQVKKCSYDMSSAYLDELKVTTVDENKNIVSLNGLRGSKAMVLDFWHTKCVKCPSALERLNEEAGKSSSNVLFVACAISQGQGNLDAVEEFTSDWENLAHVFMDLEMKEVAKKAFGFTQVPYYVVVSECGTIVGMGDPRKVDYEQLLKAEVPEPVIVPYAKSLDVVDSPEKDIVFTLDEDF